MATHTFYLTDTAATSPGWYGVFSESAPGSASTLATMNIGKLAVGSFAKAMCAGSSATGNTGSTSATSFISGTTAPTAGTAATSTTLGDSIRTPSTLVGTFASGNWVFTFGLRPSTAGMQGNIAFRLWRSVNADGSSATEITSGVQNASTTAAMTTTTTTSSSSLTFNPGSFTVTNEYLFVQIEFREQTSAGTSSTGKLNLRVGTETSVVTTDLSLGAPFMFPRSKPYKRR